MGDEKVKKKEFRTRLEGSLLDEFNLIKEDQGIVSDAEMIRWLVH